jgi:hypothetical protein
MRREDDMSLPINRVEAISRAVAKQYDPRLRVVSLASSGGSTRVELLVTIDRRRQRPYLVMVNVTRAGEAALERELRERFRDALTR